MACLKLKSSPTLPYRTQAGPLYAQPPHWPPSSLQIGLDMGSYWGKQPNPDSLLSHQANATGGGGHVQMVQRAIRDLTYSSLCFPEAIKARGMDSTEDIPYYFYRDDGLLVWEAIQS